MDAAKNIVTFDYIAKNRKMIVEVQSFGMLLVIVQGIHFQCVFFMQIAYCRCIQVYTGV